MSSEKHQRRIQRVEKEVHECLAKYLISHPPMGSGTLVTITRVELTSDLKQGKVLVSVFGGDSPTKALVKETLNVLENQRVELQREIAHQLKLRFCPVLSFEFDRGLEKAMEIDKTLRNLKFSKDNE